MEPSNQPLVIIKCIKCNKIYKSAKTLQQHMKRMHNQEVEPDVVEEVEPEVKTEENHNCDTCIKCKNELEYYKELSDALYIRHQKIEEQVEILMNNFLTQKYIKDYNEKNPENKLTEKEFNEMYKVLYPYVIPRSMHYKMMNAIDTTINDEYKDKGITKENKEEIKKKLKNYYNKK